MNTLLLLVVLSQVQDDIDSTIRRLGSENSVEREKAFGELLRLGPKAIPAALRAFEDAGNGGELAVERWVRQLRSRSWRERDEAMSALALLGTAARSLLEKHAESPEPEVAWRVKIALARIEETSAVEFCIALTGLFPSRN